MNRHDSRNIPGQVVNHIPEQEQERTLRDYLRRKQNFDLVASEKKRHSVCFEQWYANRYENKTTEHMLDLLECWKAAQENM